MSAGIQTLRTLQRPELYDELERKAESLGQGLRSAAEDAKMPVRLNRRALKLTRTITDLADFGGISPSHLAEAVQYRPRGGA